jgi:hypothetical protein
MVMGEMGKEDGSEMEMGWGAMASFLSRFQACEHMTRACPKLRCLEAGGCALPCLALA